MNSAHTPSDAPAPSPASALADGPALPLFCLPGAPASAAGKQMAAVYLVVDHCIPVHARFALLQGWLADPDKRFTQLQAHAGLHQTAIAVVPGPSTQARPDVDDGLRPVYAQDGVSLQGTTTVGFFALVPLAPGQTELRLSATLSHGQALTWALPVRDNPGVRQALMTPHTARAWLPAALGLLLHTGQALPSEFTPLLAGLTADVMHAPTLPSTPNTRAHLEIDRAVRIGQGLFVSGWSMDHQGRHVPHLLAMAAQGHATPLPLLSAKFARPDVVAEFKGKRDLRDPALGFVCWLPDAGAGISTPHWRFWAADGQGGLVERSIVVQDGLNENGAQALLHTVPLTVPNFRTLYDAHIGPALETLFGLQRRRSGPPQLSCTQFGTPVAQPEVSLIVPLYGRWDFIEHQVALFRHDPSLRRHELIYFVDDPAIHDAILEYWRSTWPLYELPFTLAYAGENLGFAGANNAAVSIARGRQVLLLNSDVIPTTPGWLDQLSQALAEQPQAGAVGAALLYSDDSIQHAGMEFERYPHWGQLWINLHPGKGWPASWLLEGAPREVPALTGACLLMPRALYLEVGGLDEGYVRGDFEDSDLCLKLRAKGLKPYLVPQAQLYHLERQSQDLNAQATTRMLLTFFNCWRHTQRWDADITRLMQELPACA